MTIQAALSEIIKYCNIGGIDIIKLTGSEKGIFVQCRDEDRTFVVEGEIKTPADGMIGEFGVTNLKMLSGLLDFSHFKDGEFKVITRKSGENEIPAQFQFKGKGSKALFNLMDIQYVPKQATVSNIPWDVTLTDLTKEMLSDFQSFAGMYSEVDKNFNILVEDGSVKVSFGQEASSMHSGVMKLADTNKITIPSMTFPVDKFIMLMKLATGNQTAKLLLTSKGLLGVDIETDIGIYRYYLRQTVR